MVHYSFILKIHRKSFQNTIHLRSFQICNRHYSPELFFGQVAIFYKPRPDLYLRAIIQLCLREKRSYINRIMYEELKPTLFSFKVLIP